MRDEQGNFTISEFNQPIPVDDLMELMGYLGKGRYGAVYSATWEGAGSGQLVAVKQVFTRG